MEEQEPVDNLEELKKTLYRPGTQNFALSRTRLANDGETVKRGWGHEPAGAEGAGLDGKPGGRWLIVLLILSALFFIGALAVAGFVLLSGSNIVSNANIETVIKGPTTVKAGSEISLDLSVANKNREAISNVSLDITYPNGSRRPTGERELLKKETLPLNQIASGETVTKTIKAVIFGEENVTQEFIFLINYNVAGSNALYQKEVKYKFDISSAPVTVTVDAPAEVNSRDLVNLRVKIKSGSDNPITGLAMTMIYPTGFTFISADPKPAFDNNGWLVGELKPGGEKEIIVTGRLEGQEEDERAFRISTGLAGESGDKTLAVTYSDTSQVITVKKSFISLTIAVEGGNGSPVIVPAGQTVRAKIVWKNNLPVDLNDAKLEVALDGDIVDTYSVKSGLGFFSSQSRKILLDSKISPALKSLAAGETGELEFSFGLVPVADQQQMIDHPQIAVSATMTGVRTTADRSNEIVKGDLMLLIKVEPARQLLVKATYVSGANPPKVDQETIYTISWTIANPANSTKDVAVNAVLPENVRWLGRINPASEKIAYDEKTRETIWTIGYLEAGEGFIKPARSAEFQVAILPSANQAEDQAALLSASVLAGNDVFLGRGFKAGTEILLTGIRVVR